LRAWVWEVANRRVHGTTHESVSVRWNADQLNLQPLDGQPPYPYVDDELRKVARDAYVSWQGSRYSVPWAYAGRSVWVPTTLQDVHADRSFEWIKERAARALDDPKERTPTLTLCPQGCLLPLTRCWPVDLQIGATWRAHDHEL
jgi:hypothetical protein